MPAYVNTAFVGLGSNLDNPQAHIERALVELGEIVHTQILKSSRLFKTKPVGPAQPDYINAAAQLDTNLEAHELLDQLQRIEQAHQRVRKIHWGPRTLDLDLLLFNQQVINSERLKVPHPYLEQRSFVIVPLYDIDPLLVLPNGTALASLWNACDSSDLVPLTEVL